MSLTVSRFGPFKAPVLLLALAAALCAVSCGSGDGFLVYTSEKDGNRDLHLMELSTLEETNLTSSSSDEHTPRLSPSRDRVAFLSERNGRTQVEVMTLFRDDRGRVPISDVPGSQSEHRWSADGARIAYISETEDRRTVFTTRLEDSMSTSLTAIEADELGPWSPDGKWILFVVLSGDGQGIYARNPTGVNELRLTEESDHSPVWSSDSRRIAFISNRDGNPEIYVMNADGSEQRRLTNNESSESDIVWAPNGRTIAYASDADGNLEIYTIKPDGSDRQRLTSNSIPDRSPVWSPDSQRIAFVSHLDDDGEIVIMNADGTGQTRITYDDVDNSQPDW